MNTIKLYTTNSKGVTTLLFLSTVAKRKAHHQKLMTQRKCMQAELVSLRKLENQMAALEMDTKEVEDRILHVSNTLSIRIK